MTTPATQTTAADADADDKPTVRHKTIVIGDREVLIKSLSDTQIAQMNHETIVLQNDRFEPERKRKAVDRLYRALQSMFVDEDDRDYAADLMADGDLVLEKILDEALALWREDGEDKPAQVRRGRPKRR